MIVQKKKAIVLLTTLMFIMVISTLILKNLNDANSYIEESNSDEYYIKSFISVDNIKNEFFDYFLKNKEQIPSLLENESLQEGVDLEYGDIKAKVSFKKYEDKYDINFLAKDWNGNLNSMSEIRLPFQCYSLNFLRSLVLY